MREHAYSVGELGDEEPEPPVPQGLGKLSAAQQSFVEFMRLDPHVLENKLAVEVEVPGHPPFWRNGLAVEFSELATRVGGISPLGGCTAAILREVGYSDAQIEDFDRRGITHAVGHGLPV